MSLTFSDHVNLYGIWKASYNIIYSGNYPSAVKRNSKNDKIKKDITACVGKTFKIFDNKDDYFSASVDYTASDRFYYDSNTDKYTDYHLDYKAVGFSFSKIATYLDKENILSFGQTIDSNILLKRAISYAQTYHDASIFSEKDGKCTKDPDVLEKEEPLSSEELDRKSVV